MGIAAATPQVETLRLILEALLKQAPQQACLRGRQAGICPARQAVGAGNARRLLREVELASHE